MRTCTLILLEAFVAQANPSHPWLSRSSDADSSADNVEDPLGPLHSRALSAAVLHYAELDNTSFGKASSPMVSRQGPAFPHYSLIHVVSSPSFLPRANKIHPDLLPALIDSEASRPKFPDGLPSRIMEIELFKQQQEAGVGIFGSEFGSEDIAIQKGGAFLVAVNIKHNRYKTLVGDESRNAKWTVRDSLDELARLCETAQLEVRGREVQSLDRPTASTFIGSGKVVEVAEAVKRLSVDTVVFDDELSSAQQRNLQAALGAQVIDRTMLILQIFAQRARTREAKLQVQFAQMQYMLPRLKTFMTSGAGMEARGGGASSGGGGQFLKGVGESQLEVDRRLFRKRMAKVEQELEQVRAKRLRRESRIRRGAMPLVALVGYTNAGKSSMLNALCGKAECKAEVYADDMLFATLDPTLRKLPLPGGREVMVADTVGFIQKLPTKLVPAFRATLEVCQDADIILHVVDSSSPLGRQQAWSVDKILFEEGVVHTPQVLALNKADLVIAETGNPPDPFGWMSINVNITPSVAVAVSVTKGDNISRLLESIEKVLISLSVRVECDIPYSASEYWAAELRRSGTVESEEYTETGYKIVASVPQSLAQRLKKAERSWTETNSWA